MPFSPRQLEILNAATKLIAEGGIQSCTIKRVAEAVGVSEPALYRHFPNKNAIIHGLLENFSEFDSNVTDVEGRSAWENLAEFLDDRFLRFANNPNLAKVMITDGSFQNDPEMILALKKAMMRNHSRTMQWIMDGQNQCIIRKDIPSKEVFRMVAGAMRLTVTQWIMSDFAFDLQVEGKAMTLALGKVLAPCQAT